MNNEIKRQIDLLTEERNRAKQFVNENGFNCTTAPFVIVKRYRDELAKHIQLLYANLHDLEYTQFNNNDSDEVRNLISQGR